LSGFAFLPAELQVTRGLSPKNRRVNLTLKKKTQKWAEKYFFFSAAAESQ
jgi:hypothetical protein